MRGLGASRALVAAAIVVCAGCATPPDREMQQAQDAIELARAEGAAQYAAVDLRAAEDALARAREAVTVHDYRLALASALDGRERAQTARDQAVRLRAASPEDADALLARLNAAIDAATARREAARRAGVAESVVATWTGVIDHATARLQEARAAIARRDFPVAVRLATEALASVDAVSQGASGQP